MGFFSSVTDTVKDIAGGASDFIFGEEPKVRTGQQSTWTPWQQDIGKRLGRELQGGPDTSRYSGRLPGTSGMSDLQQLSLTGLEKALGGDSVLKEQEEFISNMLNPERRQQQMQEYFQETVQDPMMESFQEEVIPHIRRQYAPSGYWSGHRVKQEDEAMEDLVDSLTRERTRMAYEARESDLNRGMQAAGMGSPAMRGMETGLRLGEIPRAVETEGQQAEYNEWRRRRQEEDKWLQQMMSSLGLSGVENYAIGDPGDTGLLRDVISEAAGGATGAAIAGI